MFCPLPRDSVLQSHANDVSPSHGRLLPIPNAERRHHHNFRCPAMRIFFFLKRGEREANPKEGEEKTQQWCWNYSMEHRVCSIRIIRGTGGWQRTDKASCSASAAQQTLLQQCERAVCAEGVQTERGRERRNLSRSERQGGKRGNKAPWWPEMGKAFISITCISIATTPHPGPCLL